MAAANVAGQGGRSEAFGQYHTCNFFSFKFPIIVVAYQYCRGDDVDDEADDGDKVGCDPHRAKGHQPVPIPVGIDKFCSISKMQNKKI